MTLDADDYAPVPALVAHARNSKSAGEYLRVSLTAVVGFKRGLHGVPSMLVTDYVNNYIGNDSRKSVRLSYLDNKADAKSIMEVMMLGVPTGMEIGIEVEGPLALDFAQGLVELIHQGKSLD